MPSRSTYINHHARTSRLRLVAVKTIFFHILIPLPGLTLLEQFLPLAKSHVWTQGLCGEDTDLAFSLARPLHIAS